MPASRRIGEGAAVNEMSLFVFHLPPHWAEEDLMQHFSPFGSLLRASVQRGPNGKSRGFGFVAFAESKDANLAVNAMNGFQVEGKRLSGSFKNSGTALQHGQKALSD